MVVKRLLNKQHTGYLLLLLLTIVIGVWVRVAHFPKIPPGFNQDEACTAVEAFALSETGKDKWGDAWPAYFKSWGSGQNVLMAYLIIPFIRIFGLNIFSIRILPLILGILTLPLLVFAIRSLGRYASLLGLLVIAVVPWHFMLSRWGLESNLVPFFMLLGCAMVIQAINTQKPAWIVACLVPFALSLYAYGTTVVVVPGLFLLLLLAFWKRIALRWPYWLAAAGIFAIVAAPFALVILENFILHKNLAWTDDLFFSTPLLEVNRLQQVNQANQNHEWQVLRNNVAFVNSGFNDGSSYNMIQGFKPLFSFSILLFVVALAVMLYRILLPKISVVESRRDVVAWVFFAWAVASLPLIFVIELNINRFNHFYLPCLVLSVWVADLIIRNLNENVPKTAIRAMVVGWFVVEGGLVVRDYFAEYPSSRIREDFNVGLKEAFDEAERLPGVQQVLVTTNMPLPYVYTLFFSKYPPARFQQDKSYEIVNGLYDVKRVGKFVFSESILEPGRNFGYLMRKNQFQDTDKWRHEPLFGNDYWEVGIVRVLP
ncbi:glycosyltransferase family 39 protein [Solirubrum puertoriconensis]|uniref:Glycosyltransferase RgtA/B/C/D-like domain-containing protein n=1 Tax=Solirubrum puertoriconensis TaxID=1751427 RepID=A0A9X0L6J5_SOLP1|nr:glycosyltransferase family 39 protein [Solirubrum puertoriconensis]KUG09800.1 hypothetical protein ASU33_19205 [Solirubrum puertoriconensis]